MPVESDEVTALESPLDDINVPTQTASVGNPDKPVLKPSYVNPDMDTSKLIVPKEMGRITRSKGKLILDNDPIPMDDTIPTYSKSKKKPYKKIKYQSNYTPEEYDGEISPKPRRSDRLKRNSSTRKSLSSSVDRVTLLPSSIITMPSWNMAITDRGDT